MNYWCKKIKQLEQIQENFAQWEKKPDLKRKYVACFYLYNHKIT